MPSNALPILLIGGGALLLAGGKKRKRKPTDHGELPPPPEEEEEAKPAVGEPVPEPGVKPPVTEPPVTEPGPELPVPEKPKRPLGPSGVGSCANEIYRRDAIYIDPAVAGRLSQGALTAYSEPGYYFYIRNDAQDKIFDAGLKTFASIAAQKAAPTLRSVILREILLDINNKCNWNAPTDEFDAPMGLVWEDGMRLLTLAQMMANYSDPHPDNLFKTGKRYTMPRLPLGLPEKGLAAPVMNQRVMLLATDKSLQNAEHLIGRVSKLSGPNGESDRFEIRIVDTFKGSDVRPRRTKKHGFKDSSNAFFSKSAPTGVYRFYDPGEL